jgi:hypothetical protein
MKIKAFSPHKMSVFVKLLLLAMLMFTLSAQPTRAAPQGTYVNGHITQDTEWTLAGSPYEVYIEVIVDPGVTLTIDPGVMVVNYAGPTGSTSYIFNVEGTLIANGTLSMEIYFEPGPDGWSGINITGQPGNINTGSSLNFTVLNGGGFGGSGVGANLRMQYAVVDVHACQFNQSPGDGILGDDAGAPGSANVYDSIFNGNAGYAVNFEDGSVNPVLYNLSVDENNGPGLPYGGNFVVMNSATLHGSHTWENMGLPYLILQTIVAFDSFLIIEPGVQVLSWPGNDAFDVQGVVLAEGTTIQPITFKPINLELGWSGISVLGLDELRNAAVIFEHVLIDKGGYTGGSCDLYVEYGQATVTNSQLHGSGGSGMCLDHGAVLTMTDTLLTNNQAYAMDVIDANAQFTLYNLSASGNLNDMIGVEGGTITGIHTWSKSGINTYDLFYGYVTIAPTGTLNIDPGVTLLFGDTRDITVQGTLNALGTPTNPIKFTGETSTPGLWSGLNFSGTPDKHALGRFAYSTIEYGGYGGSALVTIENADVTFTHCILRYCTADAIKIIPGLNLASMHAGPLAVQPVQINWSSLYDIGNYAINNGTSQAVHAAYNWWGSSTGPTADDNPGGTGGMLNGLVQYRPWLSSPGTQFLFLPLAIK